ncbi:ABC transporter ATP-binding protein [Tepidibacillus marianensis]|uniref:ABC transporter ATP-binding protein n=1 Tax=Tepidibacillus marianensis TaxID=3131995 RepID=UPI0030D17136
MNHLLEVNNLQVSFRKGRNFIQVIDGVQFHVSQGETLGIVGESGCGKSVTSLSIMGLLPNDLSRIDQGEIHFNGMDLTKLSLDEYQKIRGKEIAMIFQEPMTSLNPVFTVGEQLIEVLYEHTKMKRKEASQLAIEMLKRVGIPRTKEVMNEYPHQLSGGMRQRIMIAMAMLLNPKLLIADEPTTALDVTIQAQILDLMRQLKEEYQTSIIMITHDLGVVAEVCDRVVVMYAGRIVEEGDIREIFHSPKHPYTKGLLQSIPNLNDEMERLFSIPGTVPLPEDLPQGCPFAPRCDVAVEKCFSHKPERIAVSSNHLVNCWNYS